jgi:hypothetical protein
VRVPEGKELSYWWRQMLIHLAFLSAGPGVDRRLFGERLLLLEHLNRALWLSRGLEAPGGKALAHVL